MIPERGDFAVVSVAGRGGELIGFGEKLCGNAFSEYQHAFIYTGGMRIEAEPGGARAVTMRQFETPGQLTLWSTGRIPLTDKQRSAICVAARGCLGVGYSWLDYAAIGLHSKHLPAPGLRGYIASTHHLICSQLCDQVYADAGVHLFNDNRWPGFVTPAALAARILESPDGTEGDPR